MINDKAEKKNKVIEKIKTEIQTFNKRYRRGPDLYFYQRVMKLRIDNADIESFLNNDYNLEIMYATLVSWDMNSRAAEMKYFSGFKKNLLSNLDSFKELESCEKNGKSDFYRLKPILNKIYLKLDLMETNSNLVSNSKILHFLFPKMCMPMDGNNTLDFLYGNKSESPKKYLEIFEFSHEIMSLNLNWSQLLDSDWNSSCPKIIDNAIILCVGKSVKKQNLK